MTQEGFKRKLAAILSADAVGYSRLMGEDEAAQKLNEEQKRVSLFGQSVGKRAAIVAAGPIATASSAMRTCSASRSASE